MLLLGPARAEGKVLPGASYTGVLLFAFRVVANPGTATQFLADVFVRAPAAAPMATVKECQGSAPGWNCAGLLWATIPMADGSPLQLVGAPMPDFQPAPGTTWATKK